MNQLGIAMIQFAQPPCFWKDSFNLCFAFALRISKRFAAPDTAGKRNESNINHLSLKIFSLSGPQFFSHLNSLIAIFSFLDLHRQLLPNSCSASSYKEILSSHYFSGNLGSHGNIWHEISRQIRFYRHFRRVPQEDWGCSKLANTCKYV